MLRQTKEYAEFAEFIEDSGGQVKSVNVTSANNPKGLREFLDLETDNWLPNEAYNLAHTFRE
jgi:hypothetical protein